MSAINQDFLSQFSLDDKEHRALTIYHYPAPILKEIATPVEVFDSKLEQLCKNMLFTMYHAPGIGLAAPQVGISKRIFVMDIDYQREEQDNGEVIIGDISPKILINPVFIHKEGEVLFEEGCLSVPGVYEKVKRAEFVKVEFQDLKGEKHTLEADGLLSVCLQHENDHLDGVVFVDRLSFLKKELLIKKYKKLNSDQK